MSGPWDDYKDSTSSASDKPWEQFGGKTEEKPRSAIAEIANQGYAGVVADLPEMVGKAAQYATNPGDAIYGWGKGVADAAKARGAQPDLQPDPENHNIVTNTLASGARMIPQSLAPAAAVGGVLAAAPVSVPGALLIGSALGSLPAAMSQGQTTLDKAEEAGVGRDVAIPAARKTALIEGAGETLGTFAGAKLLGLGGKALSTTLARATGKAEGSAAGHVLADATDASVLKPWLKQIPETLATEVGTEMGQNAGEAYIEQQAGIDKQTPWDAAKEAVGPTIGMTALLAPFGLAGFGIRAKQNARRAETLTSADAAPGDRLKAAFEIKTQLDEIDPEAGKNFGEHVLQAIEDQTPLEIGEHLFAPPVVTAPTQPLLGYNSVIIPEVPRSDGQGAAPIDPTVGPLSAAAADAIKSGLTPTNANRVGTLLRNYATRQDAQDALDQREDGARMDIISHPRGKSGFAVVPKDQSALAKMDLEEAKRKATTPTPAQDEDGGLALAGASGLATAAFGAAGGKMASKLGIGDVDTGDGTSDGGGSGTDTAPVQSGVVGQSGESAGGVDAAPVDRFDVTHAGTAAIADPKNADVVSAYNQTQFAKNPDGSTRRVGRDHFESWVSSGGVSSDVGSQYDGHGIAKGNPLGALLNILTNGINTSRRFDSAPLTPASSAAGAGSGLGSANGAYKDGPFILLGERGKSILDGIKTVLVSDEVAASIPALQQRFPDVRFVSHSNAQAVLSQDANVQNNQAPANEPKAEAAPDQATKAVAGDATNSTELPGAGDATVQTTGLDDAAHEAATSPLNDLPEPTQAQKEAGNYKVGRINLHGLNISIENPEGSVRRGVGDDGKPWENTLAAHYGYIRGTEGNDGDHVDTFIGPNPESQKVFVVDQVNKDGSFDEHKVILGAETLQQADKLYHANYHAGWTGRGAITEMPIGQFKEWVKEGTKTNPVGKIPKPDLTPVSKRTESTNEKAAEAQQSETGGKAPAATDPAKPATSAGVAATVEADSAPVAKPDLTPDQQSALDGKLASDFERQFQQDLKDGIKRKRGLIADPADKAAGRSPFKSFLITHGISDSASDIVGERNLFRANQAIPRLFRRTGLGIDELVNRAAEAGFITESDRTSGQGVEKIKDMIQSEIAGKQQLPADMADDAAEAAVERNRRMDIEEHADSLGLPYDNEISTDRLAGMVKRVERYMALPKNKGGLLKADRVKANALEVLARIERKRAQYEQSNAEFAKAGQREQDAIADVLLDSEGMPVINRVGDLAAIEAWLQENKEWDNSHGNDPDTQANRDSGQAGAPDAQGAGQRAQSAEAVGTSEQRAGAEGQAQGLTAPTREEVLAQQAQAEQAAKDKDTADRKADKAAREEDERKRIAKASEAAAGTFELGGNALDNLTGQGGMFARGPWRSALRDGLSNINAKALSPEMWADGIKGLVNKGAAKADEVEWSGITDWLKLQTGKVTKEQVMAYLDGNGVQVEEVRLGAPAAPSEAGLALRKAVFDKYQAKIDDARTRSENYQLPSADQDDARTKLEELWTERDKEADKAYKLPADLTAPAKYSQYQLPGGSNYREVLLTLPSIGKGSERAAYEAYKSELSQKYGWDLIHGLATSSEMRKLNDLSRASNLYKSSHWDTPNVLAHVRLNDRVDSDGKRVLFVEEIQSDWGQQGKKEGFNDMTSALQAEYDKLVQKFRGDRTDSENARVRELEAMGANSPKPRIPSAPFVNKTEGWLNLALKRIITMAVEGGYDRVAFVNGGQSADRYKLSNEVGRIDVVGRTDARTGEKSKSVTIEMRQGGYVELGVDPNGVIDNQRSNMRSGESFKGKNLADVIGKDLAQKIIGGEIKSASGDGLNIGGEGMKAFYDRIVPNTTNALLKKLGGGKVETVNVDMYTVKKPSRPGGYWELYRGKELKGEFDTEEQAQSARDPNAPNAQPGFTLTPAMIEKASEGLPLFAREALRRSSTPRLFMPISEVQTAVDQLTAKWKDGPRVKVVATPDELPIDAPNDARGLIHDGTVYIVAANHRDRDGVARTLGHEAIGHYGLWKMLGEDGTRQFQAQLQLALKSGNVPLNKIAATVRGLYVDQNGKFNLSPRQEANEIAAFAVESAIDADGNFKPGFGFFKAVWAKVAQFLRDLGIAVQFTNAELQGMLVSSMKGLETGERLEGGGRSLAAAALGGQQSDSGLSGITIKPAAIVEKSIKAMLSTENATAVLVTGGNSDVLYDIARKFGKQIVFFREVQDGGPQNGQMGAFTGNTGPDARGDGKGQGLSEFVTNGFTNASRPDVVFLNVDSSNHLLYILGHEFGHTLRTDDRKLWVQMAKELQPLVRNWSGYKANSDQVLSTDDAYAEELFGDVIGQNFLNPEFWQDMAQQSPPLFSRIANKAIALLNKAARLVIGRDASPFISDMEKARSVVAGVLAQYAAARDANDHTAPDSGGAFARGSIVGSTNDYSQDMLKVMDKLGWQVEVPTLKERAQALWKDAGKKLAQGIADQFAPVKDLDGKAYGLLRLAKGASGAFETLLKGGKLKLTDNVYDIDTANRGGVVDKLLIPLQGEHHNFFRWVAAQRAALLKQVGKEHLFDQSDIDTINKWANTTDAKFDYTIQNGVRKGQTTRNRAEMYRDSNIAFSEFNKNVLDMAEQSGLIDGSTRHLWENEFYVPFYRVSDDADGGVRGMNIKGAAVRQQAFKALKGGKQKLNADLLENTLMNWAHLLDASAKNRAAKATIEAAEKMGVAMGGNQSALASMGSTVGNRNGVVWFMDGGQKRYSLIDNQGDGPYIMTALSSLEYAGMRNPVMNAMGAMKHALTVGVTASPFFKVRNLIRDSVQVIGTGPISYNVGKNLVEGWKLTDPKSDEYFRLLVGGGTIHFGTMTEGSEAKRVQALVESGVDGSTILDSDHKLKAFYRKFIEPGITAYNELGNRGEAVNRAALYNQLRKQGIGHAEASLQARDLMDFSMQGSWTSIRFLTQVVPFMNARIQGLYKLGKAAKTDPARFSLVLGATAMASLALLGAYGDDDDWKKRTESDRNNFWWFKVGGTAFRIPKPFEIGSIGTLAERGLELAFDKEMDSKRFGSQVLAILSDQLSMNPVPQLVKPILDVYANIDSFSGTPIENMAQQKLKSEYRFNDKTTMAARGASTAMNAVTGLIGKEALSPVEIDHLLRGYFGWLGTMVVSAGDYLARPATGQPDQAREDYLKKLTGNMASDLRDAPSRYVNQMYTQAKTNMEAYDTWRALMKEQKPEEAKEFFAGNKQAIVDYRRTEAAKKSETLFNNMMRMVERNRELDPDQKRERIRVIQAQKEAVAKRAVLTP